MTTNFSGTNAELSEEAQDAFFGDLAEPDEAAAAPAPDAEEAPTEEAEAEAEVSGGSEEQDSPEGDSGAPEVEEVPSPDALTASDEEPAPAEVDWEQRFKDTQAQETRHFQQLQEERELRKRFEEELTSQYQAVQLANQAPGMDVNQLAQQAEAAGIDAEQIPFFVTLAQQIAATQMQPLQAQAAENQARLDAQVMTYEEIALNATREAFRAAKQDNLTPEIEAQMSDWLVGVGAAVREGTKVYLVEPLTPEVLDIAYEAVNNPGLGNYILNHPELYETDEGVQEARVLASVIQGSPTTQPATPVRSTRDAVAAVDAAATLGGPSAPPIEEEEELFVKPSGTIHFSK